MNVRVFSNMCATAAACVPPLLLLYMCFSAADAMVTIGRTKELTNHR